MQIASLALRDRVLRKPLGLSYDPSELMAESSEWHLAAHQGSSLLAVMLLRKADAGSSEVLKMRQVAVDEQVQGLGVGSRLLRFAEDFARDQGCCRIELHARKNAVPFYLKLGYEATGDWFQEVGIPHLAMFRNL
jgi:predicted GNAT family N-acyltransferase